MNFAGRKRLKYFSNLSYPVHVCAQGEQFVGYLPDLPECHAEARNPQALYAVLEAKRRATLRQRVEAGQDIPLPNSYLTTPQEERLSQLQSQDNTLEVPQLLFALA